MRNIARIEVADSPFNRVCEYVWSFAAPILQRGESVLELGQDVFRSNLSGSKRILTIPHAEYLSQITQVRILDEHAVVDGQSRCLSCEGLPCAFKLTRDFLTAPVSPVALVIGLRFLDIEELERFAEFCSTNVTSGRLLLADSHAERATIWREGQELEPGASERHPHHCFVRGWKVIPAVFGRHGFSVEWENCREFATQGQTAGCGPCQSRT
jgi:hypothetical protein